MASLGRDCRCAITSGAVVSDLLAKFPAPVLVQSGVLVTDPLLGTEHNPALGGENSVIIAVQESRDSDPFDILTDEGCVSGREVPVFASLRDGRIRNMITNTKENRLCVALSAEDAAVLLQLATHMMKPIISAYEELSPDVGEFLHLAPATDAYLRLTRQIERFSALVERINGRQGRADNAAPVATGGDVVQSIQEPNQGELMGQ